MYHYSSACYYLVKHVWLHVSTLLKVPLLQRQCLSHHGVGEQIKPPRWAKAASWRKVAASHGRFLHRDNEPEHWEIRLNPNQCLDLRCSLRMRQKQSLRRPTEIRWLLLSNCLFCYELMTPESRRRARGDEISDLGFSTSQLTFLTVELISDPSNLIS